MMQAVDHPYLVVHSASGATAAAAASAKAAAKAADDESDLNGGMCGVCHDPLEQPVYNHYNLIGQTEPCFHELWDPAPECVLLGEVLKCAFMFFCAQVYRCFLLWQVVAGCGHAFCRVCLAEYLDGCSGAAACPSCQRPLSVDLAAATPV